jgi:hypothetical protein
LGKNEKFSIGDEEENQFLKKNIQKTEGTFVVNGERVGTRKRLKLSNQHYFVRVRVSLKVSKTGKEERNVIGSTK